MKQKHRVELYYFEDGAVYLAPRKAARTDSEIIRDGLRDGSDSPIYEHLKKGLYSGQKLIGEQYSKIEAESRVQSLADYFASLGRKVLNRRKYKV